MILSYKLFENSEIVPKVGDMVVCVGNIDGLRTHNHVGFLNEYGIEFLNKFSDRLHDFNGKINSDIGWYIWDPKWTKHFNDNKQPGYLLLKYSNRFKDVISYNLSFLLDYEKIYYSDISFIDITNRNDTISFLSNDNFDKLGQHKDVWNSSLRQNMRIGRFMKKMFPDDSDKLIEEYVNEYKFSFGITKNDFSKFKIYKGINMAKWYLEGYYAPGGGTLHSSCMKHAKSQNRLPIYTDNPDKIKMLVIKDQNDKLLGRSLLWTLDEPQGRIYMDRIYSAEDYIGKLFLDYARKKNFITKKDVDLHNLTMKVYLKKDYGPPQINPYMDTFKYFVKDEGYLTNRFKNFKHGEFWEYIDHD